MSNLGRMAAGLILASLPLNALADVTLLPGTPITGDNDQWALMRIWSPVIDDDSIIKVKATLGDVDEIEIEGRGLARFAWAPPTADTATEVVFDIRIKGPGGQDTQQITYTVGPRSSGDIEVECDPAEPRAGESALVRFVLPNSHQEPAKRSLQLLASSGSLDAPTTAGDGTYVSRWTPDPSNSEPELILFTVSDALDPEDIRGWGLLPVLAPRSLTFDAPNGSSNILQIGDRTWGPTLASPAGTVAYDIEVPPSIANGTLETVARGGKATTTTVSLHQDNNAPQIAFIPPPQVIPAGETVELAVVALGPTGAPWPNPPSFTANAGSVGDVAATQDAAMFQVSFGAPDVPAPVTIQASLEGVTTEIVIPVLAGLPSASVTLEPSEMTEETRSVVASVQVNPGLGAGASRPPTLLVVNGKAPAKMVEKEENHFEGSIIVAEETQRIIALAEPMMRGSAAGPAHVFVWAEDTEIDPGGTTPITIAVTDTQGLPIANAPVTLAVLDDGGTISPDATTDAQGAAWVMFQASEVQAAGFTGGARPVRIQANAYGLTGGTALIHNDGQRFEGMIAPSGFESDLALLEATKARFPTTSAWRKGTAVIADAGSVAAPVAAATDRTESTNPEGFQRQTASVQGGGESSHTFAIAPTIVGHKYQAEGDGVFIPYSATFDNLAFENGRVIGGSGLQMQYLNRPATGGLELEITVGAYREKVGIAGETYNPTSLAFGAGVRWGQELNVGIPLSWYAVGHFQRTPFIVFEFEDGPKDTEPVVYPAYGVKAGGGVVAETEFGVIDFQVTDTFIPFPVDLHAQASFDYPIKKSTFARGFASYSLRTASMDLGDDEAKLHDQERVIGAGIRQDF